jgi:hypothetical protein
VPKPTCAGPHPYRTPCSHSAEFDGGKQPARRYRKDRRRRRDEGARQGDLGRRHFGLHGAPITALGGSVDESPNLSPHRRTRGLPEVDHAGDACRRLEKMDPNHDR